MANESFWYIWISLGFTLASGSVSYLLISKRQIFLRLLDAEEAFWKRFGFRKGGLGRDFCESRTFTVGWVIFMVAGLVGTIVSAWRFELLVGEASTRADRGAGVPTTVRELLVRNAFLTFGAYGLISLLHFAVGGSRPNGPSNSAKKCRSEQYAAPNGGCAARQQIESTDDPPSVR